MCCRWWVAKLRTRKRTPEKVWNSQPRLICWVWVRGLIGKEWDPGSEHKIALTHLKISYPQSPLILRLQTYWTPPS